MIGVVALRTRSDGAGERVVTVCCGAHRTGNCCEDSRCVPCCPECPTCPIVQRRMTHEREADAAELRERQMFVRVSAARAEHLTILAALDNLADELIRQTRLLVDVATEDYHADSAMTDLASIDAAVASYSARCERIYAPKAGS